ncbi:unnamed protein product [Rotaria magnacalcarata]|uniref:Myb/SANT-like DNA-binding domain-containing protein n=4 Tax=Rotaria TaxID=231623 RepID=A0A816SCJ4_9BILA|nr:unnamed protein product [Rotaria magnacalcarata]CAF2112925.1 unnamed protein product [Rotaria magnacalcarata]CAF4046203.1 unnamed protein product [Rotaria magnacalcarata]CAF4118305.1 unnamed protein product [Rotaria magnacalcarata]
MLDMLSRDATTNSPTTNGTSSTKPVRRFHQRALIWDLEETRALLDLLKDERIFKAIESVRTREIYHEIAERLRQAGFNRDWNQIRGRVKNLKFSYKKARALHEEHGQSTLTCRFYDDLHYLFGHKYKRQRSKKRSLQQQQQHQQKLQTNIKTENEEGEIISNINNNEPDDITDDDEESMNEDDEQQNLYDDVSPDYIQRPEDPYPMLQSTRTNSTINQNEDSDTNHPYKINEDQEQLRTDEMDFYIKSMPPYKHQAYLIDDVLQSVFNKFLVAQQQSEQRFMSFINEQRRNEQEREERIHREQRQHQLELIQLIINQGRSHATGEEGLYALKNLRKTSETDSWTLQKSSSLVNENSSTNLIDLSETDISPPTDEKDSNNQSEVRNFARKIAVVPRLNQTNGRLDVLSSTSNPGLIRLFCIRHGERVDFAFGSSWPELAFDKAGNYQRLNLNMPLSLPRRRNPFRDFIGDSPITEIGVSQARLTGEALAANDSLAQYCYSSPAFRCIQTAHYILQGMGIEDRVKIRVEPGLFEFLGWYERGLPTFFNSSDMNINEEEETHLYNIDKNYRPIISLEKLSRDEKYIDYYNRSFKVTQQITDKHKLTGANIFFIGHAATLEVCTRQLCSLPPRSYSDFNGVIRKVSYLGLQLCERNPSDGQWTLKTPPIPPLQHANNVSFDWQTMK